LTRDGTATDGSPVSLFGATIPLAVGKQVRSVTLPAEPRLHLYAMTVA
jgi:hypothetical protein